jgi:hypothetical protein
MVSDMEDAHVAVILGEMRSNFRAFGEALEMTRTGLGRRIDDVARDLGVRIDDVARDLGLKIDDVARDVAVLKTDVADVRDRLTGVEHRLNGAPAPRRAPVRKRRK